MTTTRNPPADDRPLWNELRAPRGAPRPAYRRILPLIEQAPASERRAVEDRIEATLREMGVSFDTASAGVWPDKPWSCDQLPQIFEAAEWRTVREGFRQRLDAFECLLGDVYGRRRILRKGYLPVPQVLGSPYHELPARGLPPGGGHYFHLSGLCLTRLPDGRLAVKNHYFSHASGISYMIQNRRALVRAHPDLFENAPIELVSGAPLDIMDMLRGLAAGRVEDPLVVLLTPGTGSAAYSEHSLLARRMGIPLVQGGDLIVLDGCVHLKTISEPLRVHVIYSRLADRWIDPLVFRGDSLLGVPGLTHCVRVGSVTLVNSLGGQLADDRTLLAHADKIIRYYLNEEPILPTLPTLWMGDVDQRGQVLDQPDGHVIRPVYGEAIIGRKSTRPPGPRERRRLADAVRRDPTGFVAQPVTEGALTVIHRHGRARPATQDHIVFAMRKGGEWQVVPGALTRVAPLDSLLRASELGGGSKDTWVLKPRGASPASTNQRHTIPKLPDQDPHARPITTRIAGNFYWLGRYLERSYRLAYLIQTVETLESEELNRAERTHYRPMWNRLLPPLEKTAGAGARGIGTWRARHRLALDDSEPGSMRNTVLAALRNATLLQDQLSTEAWAVLETMGRAMRRRRFSRPATRPSATRDTALAADACLRMIPQFAGTARASMLLDEGWRFLDLGILLERAVDTASALRQTTDAFLPRLAGGDRDNSQNEIQLSALLRLLGSRDIYRRVFQMRAMPANVLRVLWNHPECPRSVVRCLRECAIHLDHCLATAGESPTLRAAVGAFRDLAETIAPIPWTDFFLPPERSGQSGHDFTVPGFPDLPRRRKAAFESLLDTLFQRVLALHTDLWR